MIKKMPWQTVSYSANNEYSYNPKRNNVFMVTNKSYDVGKTLMDKTLEDNIAPLVSTSRVRFETIPLDGDPTNVDLDNILVSGWGKNLDVTRESACFGEILRLEYDLSDDMFSYVFVLGGRAEEFRSASFEYLKTKCAHSLYTHSLRNRKYLLSASEYEAFFDDFSRGRVSLDDPDFDIRAYVDV